MVFNRRAGIELDDMARRLLLAAFILTALALLAGSAAAEDGWISGTVNEQQLLLGIPVIGDPVSGATVSVNGSTQTATTDADGKYNITLPAGNYSVKVKATGYNTNSTDLVPVAANTTTALDVILVKQNGNLVGKVTDEAGNPVALTSLVYRTGTLFDISTITGSDGTYVLKGLPVGTLNVTVTAPGVTPLNMTVTIGNGQTTTMFITVKTPVFVTVLDTGGAPIFGATVTLGNLTKITDANGTAFLETNPGPQKLTVSAAGYRSYRDSTAIARGGNLITVTLPKNGAEAVDTGLLAGLAGVTCLLFLLPAILVIVVIMVVMMRRRKKKAAFDTSPPPMDRGDAPPRPPSDEPGPRAPPETPLPPPGQ